MDSLSRGRLVLSVELELAANQTALGQYRRLAQVAKNLVKLTDQYRLLATWAVSRPAHSTMVGDLASSPLAHEIAILGDRSWIGPEVSCATTARELDQRIDRARVMPLAVSSLVLRDTDLPRRCRLLTERGITAVSGRIAPSGRQRGQQNRKCPGVWFQMPNAYVPESTGWVSLGSGAGRARRLVRRLSQRGGSAQVVIQANRLIDHQDAGQRVLARFLEDCQRGVDSGHLIVQTLAVASSRETLVPRSEPAHSILRPAA